MPKLSDTKISAAKPRAKPYKLFDMDGLFMVVTPKGFKWWRQRYTLHGKAKELSLGVYPEIGLKKAREKSFAIRQQLADGVDPSVHRQTEKVTKRAAVENTLKAIALEWHKKFKTEWSDHHAGRILDRLTEHVLSRIGSKPIAEVTADDVTRCIDRMVEAGAIDTARRVLQALKRIFKYAIGRKLITVSPVAHVEPRDHLPSVDVQHRAAITDPVQFGALLRAIDNYTGGFTVKCALQLIALTFVRPGELRHAEWPEFQLDGKEPLWRIP